MSYAAAWLKWFDVIEGGAAPLSRRMIALAGIDGASQVLDIGTGIGEPAVSVALQSGNGGQVLAIDRDPEMIALARERAQSMGAHNVRFEVADVATLDLAPGSLDAVLARWSLMFVKELEPVLSKLAVALKPGGHLVAAAWDTPDMVPALTIAKHAVRAHFGQPLPDYGPCTAFALTDVASTERVLRAAGFEDVASEIFPVTYDFASADDYIRYRTDVTGPLWETMKTGPAAERQAAFAAIKEALEPHRLADGSYRLVNLAYCICGRTAQLPEGG